GHDPIGACERPTTTPRSGGAAAAIRQGGTGAARRPATGRRAGRVTCAARGARSGLGPERPSLLVGGVELVAEPAHGEDAARTRRIQLDLGAQPLDVDVEGLGVADVVGPPDAVDELAAGE